MGDEVGTGRKKKKTDERAEKLKEKTPEYREKIKKLTHDDVNMLIIQYEALAEKRNHQDALIWAAPTLLFVALALLWGIGLDQDIYPLIRLIVSGMSTYVAVLAYQFFLRARAMEIADAEQLYSIEEALYLAGHKVLYIYHKIKERTLFDGTTLLTRLNNILNLDKQILGKYSAFEMWKGIFRTAIAMSYGLLCYNVYMFVIVLLN